MDGGVIPALHPQVAGLLRRLLSLMPYSSSIQPAYLAWMCRLWQGHCLSGACSGAKTTQ